MINIGRFVYGVLTASIVIGFSACNDERIWSPSETEPGTPIMIKAAYPTHSRASDAGFENGDRMGVYILDYVDGNPESITDEPHGKNVRYTFNGNDNFWTPAVELYWSSAETPADIIGYYPFVSSIEDEESVPFIIERRQDLSGTETSLGGYEASDFLWGKAVKVAPTADRVDLTLRHLMAGVRITLVEGTGFATDEWNLVDKKVLIPDIIPDATVNLSTGGVTPGDQPPLSITPLSYNGDWRGIVVPQTVSAGNGVISITVGGVSYTLTKNEPLTYASGKLHTFTVTVNKRQDTGKYEFLLTDEAITPWIDSEDFRDGIMREYVIVEVGQRGTLKECVELAGYDPEDVINLKIKGEIDEEDYRYMRDELTLLKSLNLYDCVSYSETIQDMIPEEAFANKDMLTHIIFPRYIKVIGHGAFYGTGLIGDLILPEGLTNLGDNDSAEFSYRRNGVFAECKSLVGNLYLPSTLRFIEAATFYRTPLTGELTIPGNVRFIGSSAFEASKFSGTLSLPDNLECVGMYAFRYVPFAGNLVIPQGIKKIREATFEGGRYNLLELHEGLEEIERDAFNGCGIKGELKLPSTLRAIEDYAFAENKFSSIIFPNGIRIIGVGAFKGNSRLSGSIAIPEKITSINARLFEGCNLLEEIIIGENVTRIEGNSFGKCYNLTSVVVNNPEPPFMTLDYWDSEVRDPFYGVPKDNFTLQVPAQSVDDYRNADGWKEFKRIAAYSNFVCRPSTACALTTRHHETLVLNSGGDWEVTHIPSWCSVNKNAGSGKTELTLTVNEMPKGSGNREDYVEFAMKGTDFTTRCTVCQYDYEYDEDQCITLQQATRGDGIDILFVGDGFDGEAISDGKYMDLVNEQMEAFFGLPPYSTYRDYFNVYACVCLSQETGVNTASTWRNTRFNTLFAGGMLMHDDIDAVFDYAVRHSPLKSEDMWKSLVIMSLNSDEYGSATTMTWNGSAVAICSSSSDPYPMDTRGIVQHEAGGHAFGKLAEERINQNRYPSNGELQQINDNNVKGWWLNISTTGRMADVPWSHFILDQRYSDRVDVFEGGYGVARGVFRSEINSCMNYGIPYYNAISRQEITRRILEYSGEGFSMDRFYAEDSDKWGSTGSSRAVKLSDADSYSASGLHRPVRIVKSNKY